MNGSEIGDLANSASQNGPALYAVLGLTVISVIAGNLYYRAASRTKPVPQPEELRAYRLFFYATAILGIFSWAVSVTWWCFFRPSSDWVQISIMGIGPDVQIHSPYYYKETVRPGADIHSLIRDDYFLIVQDGHPFTQGDMFEFDIYVSDDTKPHGEAGGILRLEKIPVKYTGNHFLSYSLQVEPGQKPQLVLNTGRETQHARFSPAEITQAKRMLVALRSEP